MARLNREREAMREQVTALELSQDAIITRNFADHRIVGWNRGATELYGWTREEALGRVVMELLQTRPPSRVRIAIATVEQDGRWEGELIHSCNDGRRVLSEVRQVLVRREDGTPSVVVQINRDITARRAAEWALRAARAELEARVQARTAELATRGEELQRANAALQASEQRFRALIERSAEAILLLAADFTVVYASPSVGAVLGHPPEAWQGRTPYHLCHPDDLSDMRAACAALVSTPGSVVSRQCRMRHLDGRWRWIEYTTTNRLDDADVGALVVNFRDITERKRSEVAEQDMNRRLREALNELASAQQQVVQQERLRALGEMASGIAHDFNNALTPLVGFSELLLLRPDYRGNADTLLRYLRLIHTGASDAASVVGRLREFYRPREPGEGVAPVDAHQLVADVIALTKPRWKDQAQAAGRPVRVETDLAPTPPVAGRVAELREVLTNLVFNAVDALSQGGTVTLRVRLDAAAPDALGGPGGRVVLEVQDDGVGMTEEVRQRCLEPFFTTKGKRGTGLGLALAYGVVRRHSGGLEIESAPGRGTIVRLKLPAYAAPPVAGWQPEPPALPAPAASAGRRLRVLVVDDEPLVRETTAAYLAADGHGVRTAVGGHEAVRILGEEPFDLVVTDRAMPDLSGDAVARAARALGTPVLLLTGFGDLMGATGERVPGVARILSKPVKAATLREAVAAVIAGPAEQVLVSSLPAAGRPDLDAAVGRTA